MPRAAIALAAALGLCSLPSAAQDWFHVPQQKDPLGDLSDERREALLRLDPGVQGSQQAVGSAVVDQAAQLREHGDEANTGMSVVQDPEGYSRLAGVKILNATPASSFGAAVVQTDHGLMPAPLIRYEAGWQLEDRARRPALIVMEMQEDYRPYIGYLTPKIVPLVDEFRAQGLPIIFTTWVRRPDDGLYGAGDRATGVQGIRDRNNPNFIYKKNGAYPMKELMPTPQELAEGRLIKTIHANKFADMDAAGRSIMSDRIRELGVDTLFITGGWTDICVAATTMDAIDSRNLDVLIVSDAVATTSPSQQSMLKSLGSLARLMDSSSLLSYLEAHRGDTSYLLEPVHRSIPEVMLKSSVWAPLGLHTTASKAFVIVGLPLLCTVIAVIGLWRRSRSRSLGSAYEQPPLAEIM